MIVKNKCFAGNCIYATQGKHCMVCSAPNANMNPFGRGKYIYPGMYERCDCGSYKNRGNLKDCIVRTPQFNPDKTIREFKKQSGVINTDTWVFYPSNPLTGHVINFMNKEEFDKANEKILEAAIL